MKSGSMTTTDVSTIRLDVYVCSQGHEYYLEYDASRYNPGKIANDCMKCEQMGILNRKRQLKYKTSIDIDKKNFEDYPLIYKK